MWQEDGREGGSFGIHSILPLPYVELLWSNQCPLTLKRRGALGTIFTSRPLMSIPCPIIVGLSYQFISFRRIGVERWHVKHCRDRWWATLNEIILATMCWNIWRKRKRIVEYSCFLYIIYDTSRWTFLLSKDECLHLSDDGVDSNDDSESKEEIGRMDKGTGGGHSDPTSCAWYWLYDSMSCIVGRISVL